jgi:DNA-directed RNA polymerase specialized sigma24 family protein
MCRIPSYKFVEKSFDPRDLERFANEDSLWYEPAEEVEQRLDFGRKRAAQLVILVNLIESCLTGPQCRCAKLYYFEGKSLREIGAITGVHFTTVHQHIRAATTKLRREVDKAVSL